MNRILNAPFRTPPSHPQPRPQRWNNGWLRAPNCSPTCIAWWTRSRTIIGPMFWRMCQRHLPEQSFGVGQLCGGRFDRDVHRVEQLPGAQLRRAIRTGELEHIGMRRCQPPDHQVRCLLCLLGTRERGPLHVPVLPVS